MSDIPENWKTLNVARDLRIRGSYPQDLRIKRIHNSANIYAQYLPSKEDDPREFQGRCQNGKGKRLVIQESMNTSDILEAAKRSVKWVQSKQKELRLIQDEQLGITSNTLEKYWNIYFQKTSKTRQTKRNYKRWEREEILKWSAAEYGISNQPFSHKSVDLISRSDFEDYFSLLERRSKKSNGSSGSGMKGQQKTLINKLLAIAENDFIGHRFPSFPPINKDKKQVQHFTIDQWKLLLRTVFELGNGKEGKVRTQKQYQSLGYNPNNRQCERNWVDLYHALQLEWFFYLRAEDMCRLKSEWFTRKDSGSWICFLETTKKDRELHQTTHYRRDADSYLKRIIGSKPTGYMIFPHMNRPVDNEGESGVLLNLNFLLKIAIEKCLPDFPKSQRKWTTIRHTAFRLTLEDMPELGVQPDINSFADNGHTSPQQLRATYLRYMDAEQTASRARKKIQPTPNVRFGGKIKSLDEVEDVN